MIKLTRLNNHLVAINPDHIGWAEATPDTTLCLIGGEKVIVRETLDELIDQVVEFRRRVRVAYAGIDTAASPEGDPPRVLGFPTRAATDPPPPRRSYAPGAMRSRGDGR